MSNSEILTKLEEIVQDVLDDDTITLTNEMSARDIENWDSLRNIQIIVAVEQAMGVKFSTTDISSLRCVGDFVELIGQRRQ